jgi:hypothetical protein
MSISDMTFVAFLATILLCFIVFIGVLVVENNDDEARCEELGGKLVRSTCFEKSAIIPLEGQ